MFHLNCLSNLDISKRRGSYFHIDKILNVALHYVSFKLLFQLLKLSFCRIVEFATYADMKNALDKLDDTEINGRRIKLIEDRPRRRSRRLVSHHSTFFSPDLLKHL